jgi:protein O-GlcNAc transferase
MSFKINQFKQMATPRKRSVQSRVTQNLECRFREGKALELAKDFSGAEKVYRELVASFERNHFNAATPNAALGYVLLNQRKFEEAERALRRSTKLNPDLLEAYANLAAVYRFTERWRLCITAAKLALKIEPKHLESLLNLAEAQKEARQYGLSVQNFLLALSLDQNNLEARKGLESNYVSLGEPSVSLPMFRKIFEMDPELWPLKSYMLFAMQYGPALSNEAVLEEHMAFGKLTREKIGPPQIAFANRGLTDRRLKVGYISSDFKEHVVMRFVEEVFAAHDRDRFEVVLISTSHKEDKETGRIRGYADQWIDISEIEDARAAPLIREQEVDILVDLAGHSGVSRLPLLARRLAPVQILWCGYSGTSGIDTMDYIIVDEVLAPQGEKTYFSETALRLPAAYVCFTPRDALEPGPLPFERNGFITFGCMNNPSKINRYVVGWWAEILKAIPDSVLLMRYALFVDPLVRERIARMFRECGIADSRYQMLEGKANFVSVYQDVDIALDTFPYNGTTTTCEALWMGVPVVALRGDRFVSRVGASLLTYTGLRDLTTESPRHRFGGPTGKRSEACCGTAPTASHTPGEYAGLRPEDVHKRPRDEIYRSISQVVRGKRREFVTDKIFSRNT